VNSLDFTAPVQGPTTGALDGNASANRTSINGTITGLNIANGATFWIRWTSIDAGSSDDGLAVDDFCLTPQGGMAEVSVAVSPAAADEDGATNLVYTFTRSNTSAGALTANFSVGGNATFNTDYTQISASGFSSSAGTVTFAAGQATTTVTIDPTADGTVEPDETIILTVTTGAGYNVGSPSSATGTIMNDDHELSINATTAGTEGNVGQSNMTFTVTLSPLHTQTVTVNYSTANGAINPALGGSACGGMIDYISQSGTLIFTAGETVKTIDVPICGDTRDEPDETLMVTLAAPTNATIASGQETSTGTITDDDAKPAISINDATMNEGDSNTTAFNFTVSLSNPSQDTVTIDYQTQDNSASTPADYTAITTTTLTFDPDETSKTVTVLVNGDTVFEPGETFFINLTNNSSNSEILDSQGLGMIANDDTTPTVQFASASPSGAEPASPVNLQVTLSNATYQTVMVNYAVNFGSTATGGGTDYTLAAGSLTFNPGETSKNLSMTINDDNVDENDETIIVDLSSPSNAILGTPSSHTYTIQDNDAAASFSIDDITQDEGNSGTTSYTFTVTKSGATELSTSVSFTTGSSTASAGSDYTTPSGMLTFGPGETSKTIAVLVNGDTTYENNETFFVNLSGANNATITDAQGVGTITNDDAAPNFAINDVSANEGTGSGTTAFTFTITKNGATELSATVDFVTADGTTNPAIGAAVCGAGVDYASSNGTLAFAANETTKTATVNVCPDSDNEANETFFVNLSNAMQATIGDSQGAGTVTNDDGAVSYLFQGFFAPIDTPPLINTTKAGSAVPVKWRLSNSGGAPVSDPASFAGLFSYAVDCGSSAQLEAPLETTAPGESSLTYLGEGNWQINWKTLPSYQKGSCRVLDLLLNDGTHHYAHFKFK